ncbi:MAG: TolC family protein [Draconibacterium sp.]|nr:TolC family protein [Draconibacterium sp.]
MKRQIILSLLLIFGFAGWAQTPLSLTDAITIALENNYGIIVAKGNQQVSEIQNNWGTAGRYPYVNLSLGNDNSANINNTENYKSNRFTGGASVNWTLFDGFSVRITKTRLDELENLSRNNTAIMIEGTIQSVILAYYNVLLQKEKLATFQEVSTLSEDRYKQMQDRKAYGAVVTYDVLQAQTAYLSDRSGYLLQEVAFKNSIRNLTYLMAVKENIDYEFTDVFEAIPEDYLLDDLEAQMFENNKSLRNQFVNQRLLENAIAAAKSNFSPALDFRGGVTGTSTHLNFKDRGANWSNSANFYGNFTLSWNLYSGGNRKRAVQIAEIDQEVGLVKIDDMKHGLTNSLANLYEFYLVRKELLGIARENVKAAKLNLQISQEKFESGAINSFNFRDVQTFYLRASQAELEAIYYFIDAHTSMLRMTGVIVQQYE